MGREHGPLISGRHLPECPPLPQELGKQGSHSCCVFSFHHKDSPVLQTSCATAFSPCHINKVLATALAENQHSFPGAHKLIFSSYRRFPDGQAPSWLATRNCGQTLHCPPNPEYLYQQSQRNGTHLSFHRQAGQKQSCRDQVPLTGQDCSSCSK